MYQLHGSGMPFMEVDPGYARIIYLLEKLSQVRSPLMVNKGIFDQGGPESVLQNSQAQIQIFSKPHVGKTSCDLIDFAGESHIKTPGMKFTHLFAPSPNSTCCEKGGHGKINGFLKLCEIRVRPVGPSKCIGIVACQASLSQSCNNQGESHNLNPGKSNNLHLPPGSQNYDWVRDLNLLYRNI